MAARTYRIQKTAELTGVPAGLIRAWERRYGVLRPRRTAGGYRAYTEHDIELLRRLKKLTGEGVAIGDAVLLAKDLRRELKAEAVVRPIISVADATQRDRWLSQVLDGAAQMNQQKVGAVLDEVLSALSPIAAYEQVMVPIQREVGERWHRGTVSVAEEHLVTHEVRGRLLSLLRGAPHLARRHIICACLPSEDHEIGLLGAALRFRHAGVRVTYLGPRTPLEQLVLATQTMKPDGVALSAVHDTGRKPWRAALTSLVKALPAGVKIIVGGRVADLHTDIGEGLGITRIVDDEEWNLWP